MFAGVWIQSLFTAAVVLVFAARKLTAAMQLFEELIADAQPNEAILENLKADMIKASWKS